MIERRPRNERLEPWHIRMGDRFCEPLHLNLLSAFVSLLGSHRSKVAFDLVRRRHYAYSVLRAADIAMSQGISSITIVEFGVATGAGLLNLCHVAELTTKASGIRVEIIGFDTGSGLPRPHDFRDHPELFQEGDFPMDFEALGKRLPANARLVLGPIGETVPEFMKKLSPESPLGFAAIDVDYYSSAKDALKLLTDADPEKYLPLTLLYLDDITDEFQNQWCGELLAMEEFNKLNQWRKIEKDRFLKARRVFKNARWLDQIHLLHVLDHPYVQTTNQTRPRRVYPALSPALFIATS
jgi:hypothetical protein